jgi:hypothetical protein
VRTRALVLSLLVSIAAAAASGCTYDMSKEQISPLWTHESAVERANEAIRAARQHGAGRGGPLTSRSYLDLNNREVLAHCEVRKQSVGWPIPGATAALPFLEISRGRAYQGVIEVLTLMPVYGLVADLLVFSPFGYSCHAVIVEYPQQGNPELGNGYFYSRENWVPLFYDEDDRWLWRENRMDSIAEALEFLVREAKAGGPPRK